MSVIFLKRADLKSAEFNFSETPANAACAPAMVVVIGMPELTACERISISSTLAVEPELEVFMIHCML